MGILGKKCGILLVKQVDLIRFCCIICRSSLVLQKNDLNRDGSLNSQKSGDDDPVLCIQFLILLLVRACRPYSTETLQHG